MTFATEVIFLRLQFNFDQNNNLSSFMLKHSKYNMISRKSLKLCFQPIRQKTKSITFSRNHVGFEMFLNAELLEYSFLYLYKCKCMKTKPYFYVIKKTKTFVTIFSHWNTLYGKQTDLLGLRKNFIYEWKDSSLYTCTLFLPNLLVCIAKCFIYGSGYLH